MGNANQAVLDFDISDASMLTYMLRIEAITARMSGKRDAALALHALRERVAPLVPEFDAWFDSCLQQNPGA